MSDMKTIQDLIALLEREVDGTHLLLVEMIGEGTIDGFRIPEGKEDELLHWHKGRHDAYRHALAQARHVAAAGVGV